MISAFVTAVRTLTIIPIPGEETKNFQKSIKFFPVVGVLIALFLFPVYWLCLSVPQELYLLRGVIIVFFGTVITGCLHIDGLADAADGFLGGRTRESVLKILKDSRIGTFGAVAIVFDLLLKVILYQYLVDHALYLPIAMSLVNSRFAQGATVTLCNYARGPQGTAAPFSGAKSAFPLLLIELLVANVLACFFNDILGIVFSLLTAGLTVLVLNVYFNKRIGGITGDCIGAVSEVFEICYLFVWCIYNSVF